VVLTTGRWPGVPSRSLLGEALGLPVVHIAYLLPAELSQWAERLVTDDLTRAVELHKHW
jgi:hypothetical protein